ncbi:Mrp/NBP35 family ATP-binding protein [Kamptonema cortianum]|nr:Mrp/NBP35 family ATP-binding protein [Geitlerinema splendidum]MDK3156127.1 Mrp/NBP35 family ATP-binding protein [Kamptonema cortianum]
MSLSVEQVLEALKVVQDPDLHRDIVSLGFVQNVKIDGGVVSFTVELTTPACPVKDILEQQAHDAVAALPGVQTVNIEMTAQVRTRQTQQEDLLPEVKQVIAIASGKGGVGKSTVTVNVAVALAQQGAKVGLLDADVYGPSIPLMMGTKGEAPLTRNSKIIPIERFGVKMMSLGFLIPDGQAPLWRGPMVAGTVRQLLADVAWGELDYLIVDLPPGTGDAPMTLAQQVPLTGVVIVTTPHNVAANIAGSCASLFRRLNTSILGVIENMGTAVCQHCGQESRVFAGTSGEELATGLGVPYLGSVPLDAQVSESADRGLPSLIAHPESHQATAFREVSGQVAAQASVASVSKAESTGMAFIPTNEQEIHPQ